MNNQIVKAIYIDVVLNRPIQQRFTYSVPANEKNNVQLGYRVYVPFGRKEKKEMAYVINSHCNHPLFDCKTIIEVIDDEAFFDQRTLQLAQWISDFYICSLGEALALFVPKETKSKPVKQTSINRTQPLKLNSEQQNAVNTINSSIKQSQFQTYLLHGVTGSGKTEVYKHLVQLVLQKGKQALIIVPEIALTPQTIHEFRISFGDCISIIHSRLNPKERFFYWLNILHQQSSIILGARSAVFTPSSNLGIIIIDEEHETSYKSSDTPRYHTRQVALKLAQSLKIPLVLGSATPCLETYKQAKEKHIGYLRLSTRHASYPECNIHLVNMKEEKTHSFVSKQLFEQIADRLNRFEQVILFLNRRGYAPSMICKSCGYHPDCNNCHITLSYHQEINQLRCHYCGHTQCIPLTCTNCKGCKLQPIGYGTERLEKEIKQNFISAKVLRMDSDTTRSKGSHERILNAFLREEANILIGTQMITKGLHFPKVTLVGVLMADVGLNLPDFRASEKTFNLLTQISGRAGRSKWLGEVIIQTYLSNHYVLKSVQEHNHDLFYHKEIQARQKFNYPPYTRLAKLLIRGTEENQVESAINQLATFLQSIAKENTSYPVEILGPSPSVLSKLKRYFRYQIILKCRNLPILQQIILKGIHESKKMKSVHLEIDIDPINML